ncbi:hypothetical protein FQA39_LY01167 [Lamprigera yunnana]|nr:hypothetical protein FQA39_LY01167 [Lamprigera yunnana]
MLVLILLSIILLIFIYLYFSSYTTLQYWKRKGIAHEEPSLFFGNLKGVALKKICIRKRMEELCDKFKAHRYFGYYQFLTPSLVVMDADLLKQIFVKNFEYFSDHPDFFPKDADPFLKKTVFGREGEDWQDMRRILSPTFTRKKMKTMFAVMRKYSENFADYYSNEKGTVTTVEMMNAYNRLVNDIIVTSTLSIDCDSFKDQNNEFFVTGKQAFDFSGWKNIKFLGSSLNSTLMNLLGIKFFDTKVKKFYTQVVKDLTTYREKHNVVQQDVLQLLLDARKGQVYDKETDEIDHITQTVAPEAEKASHYKNMLITDEDIAAQIITYFFGSYDTVSITMSHMTYELVVNPDIQNRLRNEIETALKSCDGEMTYEVISNMKYLDMVVSETLRFWVPPFMLNRKCVKPFVVEPVLPHEKSFVIEPGTVIIIPASSIHKNPKYYKNPEKFDPERFSDENKGSINPYTYIPFGIGPRHCIGNRFGILVVKTLMVSLLSRFEIVPVEKTVIPLEISKTEFVLRSDSGYWFGLKPLNT